MATDRGSVRYHRNGWEIRLQVGGRRVTRRVAGANNRTGRRAAEDALAALAARMDVGGTTTVTQMVDDYIELRRPTWSPTTLVTSLTHRKLIDADIGHRPIDEVTTGELEALYARWGANVGPSTVRRRHIVLASAYRRAERTGLVLLAPTRNVDLPGVGARDHTALPAMADVVAAVDRIGHQRLRTIALLAVATGARRGELVGLRWSDVDLQAGTVKFAGAVATGPGGVLTRKSTKRGKPRAVVIDPGTVAVLKAWRKEARLQALAAGHRFGPADPVLSSPTDPAAPWAPERVTHAWDRHRTEIGLTLRFHDLRHLQATTLLAAGLPVNAVAERLGHASTRMTLDVYAHAMPAHDQAAADIIGRARTTGN